MIAGVTTAITAANAASCSLVEFVFFDVEGNPVSGNYNDDGICVFEEANCHPNSRPSDCCIYDDTATEDSSTDLFYRYLYLCLLLPLYYLREIIKLKAAAAAVNVEGRTELPKEEQKKLIRRIFEFVYSCGFLVYVVISIDAVIFTRKSYQTSMSVSHRNLLMSAEAFMVPFYAVFQFIEDIILVQIGHSLGAGDRLRTDHLVHAGIAGSIVTGLLAGGIGTYLGMWPSVFNALTNPGRSHDRSLYEGCEWFGESDESESKLASTERSEILPYWMLKSWAMVFQQTGMVLSGFFLGAGEVKVMGWILTTSISLNLVIWFSNVGTSAHPLTLLGIADIAADIVIPFLSILYLSTRLGAKIHDRTGVSLSVRKLFRSAGLAENKEWSPLASVRSIWNPGDNLGDHEVVPDERSSLIMRNAPMKAVERQNQDGISENKGNTMQLLAEGLKIMYMDVAIQGCTTFTLYVALSQDSAVAYQISALQSALPQFGYGFATGISLMFKLTGSHLLSGGRNEVFVTFAKVCICTILLMTPAIALEVTRARRSLAPQFGFNACAYANNSQCVPFFTEIFGPNGTGGIFTLEYTFVAFAFGAIVDSVGLVLRSVLLTLLDFDFLVKSTTAAVLVYAPVMYAVTYLDTIYKGQAISYYVAMNIPQLFLIVVILFRLHRNFKKVLNGDDGPWKSVQSKGLQAPASTSLSTLSTGSERDKIRPGDDSSTGYKRGLTPMLLSRRRCSNSSGGSAMH